MERGTNRTAFGEKHDVSGHSLRSHCVRQVIFHDLQQLPARYYKLSYLSVIGEACPSV
jgi:hypothetical protein